MDFQKASKDFQNPCWVSLDSKLGFVHRYALMDFWIPYFFCFRRINKA